MKKRNLVSGLLLILLFLVFTAPGPLPIPPDTDNIHYFDRGATGLIQREKVWDKTFADLAVAAVTLTATKTDALFTDHNSNTEFDPGDVISYTVVIQNSSDMAENVVFDDTIDPNTTEVGGSLSVTPIARNDSYAATGNISITVPDGAGDALGNDSDPDGGTLTVTEVQSSAGNVGSPTVTTASGLNSVMGSVTMLADGSFSYAPPPGFTGTDTFTYQVTDDEGDTDTATVSIVVSDRVWFVDNSSGGSDLGTFNDPFTTITSFNSAQGASAPNPTDGDVIFVYQGSGNYIDGINLRDSQVLLGQGIDLLTELGNLGITQSTFSDLTSSPASGAGNRPVLTDGSGNGIALASGNTIMGLTVGNTSGIGITGSSVGNLTINNVGITGSGKAFDVNGGGTLNVDLDEVTVTSSASGGFSLQNASGATTIANVNITTTGGTGLLASSAGTFTVTGSGNQVDATSGTGVNITNTTIGANNIMFQRIRVNGNNSANTAIILTGTGSGTFTVTGDGSTSIGGNGSGGTIQDLTGSDAITLNNTGGRVTLQNMIIQDIGDSDDNTDNLQTRSFRDGIHGENVNGGLTLQSVTMRRFSDHAILGALFSDGTSLTNWSGLEIHDSLFENSNRFHISGRGDDLDEGMIRIRGLTGKMVVDNSTIQDGGRGLDITTPAGAGTLDATIQQNTFENLYKEFSSGGTVNVGVRGVSFEARGNHDMVVRIGDPDESNSSLGNTFINNMTASVVIFSQEGGSDPHTGDVDAVISQNTFQVTDHSTSQASTPDFSSFNFPQGGVSLNPAGTGTFEAIISNNLFDEVMHAAGGLGQLTIGHNTGNGDSEFIVRGNEFREPWDMALQLRAEGNNSMAILVEDNTWTEGLVGGVGTDFQGGNCGTGDATGLCPAPFQGMEVSVRNNGSMDLTLRNEVLPQHDDVNNNEATFIANVQAQAGNVLNLYLDDNKAPDGYRLTQSAGTFNLFRENASDETATEIIDGNGNTGGNGTVAGGDVNGDNTNPPVVTTSGVITPTDTAPVLPNISIPLAANFQSMNSDGTAIALTEIRKTDVIYSLINRTTPVYLASTESVALTFPNESVEINESRPERLGSTTPGKATNNAPAPMLFSGGNINLSLGTLDPGQEVTIEFQATIDDPLPAGVDRVQNQATITGDNFSPVLTTDPDPNPDLPPADGETITPVNVELDLTLTIDEGWRMLASPINGLEYGQMLDELWTQGAGGSDYNTGSPDPNVFTWPNTISGVDPGDWAAVSDLDIPIPSGSGFLVFVFTNDEFGVPSVPPFPKPITLSGPTHAGDVTPTMNEHDQGWTLVGNPYIVPVAFDDLQKTNLTDVAYVYDPNATGVSDPGPINGNGGAWRTTDGTFGDLTDGIIAPGQGFFVQNNGDGALTFTEAGKTTGGQFYGKQKELRNFVRLEVQGESLYNSAWIRFSGDGSDDHIYGDALELQPLSRHYALLGARKANGTLMDIAHFPLDTRDLEIPLAVEATRSGPFTIRATDLDLPAGMALYLYDRQTGESMPMGDDSFEYSFTLTVDESQNKSQTVREILATGAVGPHKAKTTGTDRFLITTSPGVPAGELPDEVALGQNYPNPFNPTTVIRYQIPVNSEVRLEVYDMLGRRVATLVDGQIAAGTHQISFNASGLSSGIYLYRLQVGSTIMTRKLTILK